MIDSPCMECEERQIGCHASCEKYERYLEERKEIKLKAAGLAVLLDYNNRKARRLFKRKGK